MKILHDCQKYLVIFILSLFVLTIFSTPVKGGLEERWTYNYGGSYDDVGRALVPIKDEGYLLVGTSNSFGPEKENDVYLVKTNLNGYVGNGGNTWEKNIGGPKNDEAYSASRTNDKGFIIAGATKSYGNGEYDFWLIKIDSKGKVIWNRTYGGLSDDKAYSVIQTKDNGFLIGGTTTSYGSGNEDFWIVKTSEDGTMMWSEVYGGNKSDVCNSAIEDDNGYLMAGSTKSFGNGGKDAWIVKVDKTGELIWNKTYGGDNDDEVYSMLNTTENNYMLAGSTESYGNGEYDFWLLKLNEDGIIYWNKTYGGELDDQAYSLIRTSDNHYILGGYTDSKDDVNGDFWIVETNSEGDHIFDEAMGGKRADIAYTVINAQDNEFVMGGKTLSYSSEGYDFWIVKIESPRMLPWYLTGIGIFIVALLGYMVYYSIKKYR